ncbi:hypothetical protein AWH49_02850 [Domibacillus aminovorans]|uniref:Nitroreductase domain-containing protein n=1 Tax=Domibacillus aminovorans TaxID=29332 RepID=A0A177L5Q9_9BACI|nr:hypothetical protein AWH49_02850 [Domibacillus aminovorans]
MKEAPVFFVFCLDFYRAKLAAEKHNRSLEIVHNIQFALVGSALSNTIAAAESMNLGIVPVGGIRKDSQKVIELLDLPEYVFPVAGLAVGHPEKRPDQKPRLPIRAVHHKEKYHKEHVKQDMDEYDTTYSSYLNDRTDGKESANWSEKIAAFYDTGFEAYEKNVPPALKKKALSIGEKGIKIHSHYCVGRVYHDDQVHSYALIGSTVPLCSFIFGEM